MPCRPRATFPPSQLTSHADCLRSLSFANLDTRRHDIETALPDTCNWLFGTAEFEEWRCRTRVAFHNGVLWIKGKPGAGKSTLIKHTLRHYEATFASHLIAAYFFHARGGMLEKNPLGMLRSIVFQLVDKDEGLYEHFVPIFREKRRIYGDADGSWQWQRRQLEDFLVSVVQRRRTQRPLLLLVDALDECADGDIRDVVGLLESLSTHAAKAGTTLRICLSSRHYPHVSMKRKLELTVEGTPGHCQDIATYLSERLIVRDDKIEAEIRERANGIFMWVVIVISLLNKAYTTATLKRCEWCSRRCRTISRSCSITC